MREASAPTFKNIIIYLSDNRGIHSSIGGLDFIAIHQLGLYIQVSRI
jgi:hypothetical protein